MLSIMSTEASLLGDIASLAALINKHKASGGSHPYQPVVQPSSRRNPYSLAHKHPPHPAKKFSNLSFKPTSQIPPNNTTLHTSIPTQPPLVHTHAFQLVKPKPTIPTTQGTPPSTPSSTSSPTSPTPFVKRGNKLVRKSVLKAQQLKAQQLKTQKLLKASPHKKFILKNTTAKSVSSSPSLKLKQIIAAKQTPGFYGRQLSLNPAFAGKRGSILATYFRHGNTLVRKQSNKYVRPGVLIPDKKPLVKPSYRTPTKTNGAKKVTTQDGQVYMKTPRGRSMVRSSKKLLVSPPYANKTTSSNNPAVGRVLASNRVKRSLKQAREKKVQYCLFYNKFGKCNRKESCKYKHDPDKVAVCRQFLKGKCEDPNCLLQHKIDSDKMPVCWHFLRGVCGKENCPYSHVYVNPQAEECLDFQNGYCPNGKDCKLKHVYKKRETEEDKARNAEKRKIEAEEEQRDAKRKKDEAKEIRPNFSAFFQNKE